LGAFLDVPIATFCLAAIITSNNGTARVWHREQIIGEKRAGLKWLFF
jgi:hypothetical protein